jgi:hypothetical protein
MAVVRRFKRSRDNFERFYKPIADAWTVYDNSRRPARTGGFKEMKKAKLSAADKRFYDSVKRAMPAAALRARKIARMYGTTIVVWENGKIVEKKP